MKRAMLMLAFVAVSVPAVSAGAQAVSVGYPPQQSPFRDLEYHSELSLGHKLNLDVPAIGPDATRSISQIDP